MHCTGKDAAEVCAQGKGKRNPANMQQNSNAYGSRTGRPFNISGFKKKKKVFTTHRFLLLINFLEERTKPLGSRSNTQRTREGTKQT